MFEDCGYKVYEGTTTEYYTKDIDNEIGAPPRYRQDVRESTNDIHKAMYEIEEQLEAANAPPEVKN